MTNKTKGLDIAAIVKNAIAEALLASPDKVVSSARLISDLKVESIDIVDVRFRVEQEIGFKINQDAMTARLGKNLTQEEFDKKFTVQFIIDHVQMLCDQKE